MLIEPTTIRGMLHDDLHIREMALVPSSCNDELRTVEAILATDSQITSVNARTGRGEHEVWRMDGAEYDHSVPLMDNHSRASVRAVVGSVTNIRSHEGQLRGTLRISEAEPAIWTKVKEGHIRAVSGGVRPLEGENIGPGKVATIRGTQYTAPSDRDMRVLTRWQLREVSLVPIGADPSAKIRSGDYTMTETQRAFLATIGLRAEANMEEAKTFYDSLPEITRSLADAYKPSQQPDVVAKNGVTHEAKNTPAVLTDSQRAEVVAAERARVADIHRQGEGLPLEVVRKAVDEGWTLDKYAPAFLDAFRTQRSAGVLPSQEFGSGFNPAIHSRSKEADCTIDALGMGLAMRGVSGDDMFRTRGAYVPENEKGGLGVNYRVRRVHDEDSHRKAMEKRLEQADRYASLSMHDVCREACRIDGHPVTIHMSPAETFRTAVSGSALANIFTTNINAQFLTGYMDFSDTTVGWVSEADVNNFLTNERDMMGKFGSLQPVKKGRPAEHLDTNDWKESYKIARYGGQFVVDEQDIINDRFGAIESESPRDMGLSAAQIRPNLVYSILLNNAALDATGGTLFNATAETTAGGHANSTSGGSSALAAGSLQTAIAAMAKHRINKRVLNIKPRFLLVPQDLWATAKILLTSAQRIIASSDGGTANPLIDVGLTTVLDDRLGVGGIIDPTTGSAVAGSATNWYLAARPGEEGAKTIEVGYLRGSGRAPQIRSFVLDKGQWGMGWDVKFDIGAKALDFRGLYKSAGV